MSEPYGGAPEGMSGHIDGSHRSGSPPRDVYGERDRYDRRPDFGGPGGGGYPPPGRYGEPPRGGYGGPPPGGKAWKPGDWTCPVCQSHCFASRDTCFRCGADRMGQRGPPPGSFGPPPGAFPFPGAPPPGAFPAPVTLAAAAPVYLMRPPPPRLEGGYGDAVAWGRGPIQDGNYPQRYEVFEYQPHDSVLQTINHPSVPDSGAGGPGQGYAPQHAAGKPFRQGDWNCPKCQAHNFASRMACFRCGASKVHDA